MAITHQEALLRCIEHREIFHDEMLHLFRQIMSGEMSPTMIAALTMGLRVKKETIGEIAAAAQVMREFSTKVPMADTTNLLDIVGTGGGDFADGFLFHAQAHGEGRDHGGRHFAGHDLAEQVQHFVVKDLAVFDAAQQGFLWCDRHDASFFNDGAGGH